MHPPAMDGRQGRGPNETRRQPRRAVGALGRSGMDQKRAFRIGRNEILDSAITLIRPIWMPRM